MVFIDRILINNNQFNILKMIKNVQQHARKREKEWDILPATP